MAGVIMVLCGIPACGKTYLAKLLTELSLSSTEPNMHIFHICYDDLIPSNLDLKTDHLLESNSLWKYYRKLVSQCVEKVLMQFTHNDSSFEEIVVPNSGLPSLCDFWRDFIINQTTQKRTCCFFQTQNWVEDTCHIFLIDDNMYYRSMRHEYFLLARKYSLGYGQVFIDCPLEIALTRNISRDKPVETNTVVTMANKLQAPLPEDFPWELNSVKLNAVDVTDLSVLDELKTLIRKATNNPVQPLVEEDHELKEKSRAALLGSVLYQTDQTLRRSITEKMKQAKEQGYTKQQMKSLAEQINTKRKLFLEELKSVVAECDVSQIGIQTETPAEDQQTYLLQQLTPLLAGDRNKCRKILNTLITKDHFDVAVKYMFENYVLQ